MNIILYAIKIVQIAVPVCGIIAGGLIVIIATFDAVFLVARGSIIFCIRSVRKIRDVLKG